MYRILCLSSYRDDDFEILSLSGKEMVELFFVNY